MISVPTNPAAHLAFDLLAWAGGTGLGWVLYRWRLKNTVAVLTRSAGPGYFAALAAGAIPGAWLAGSFNTLKDAAPALSHSVVGALAGAIIAIEAYKAVRGIHGSTGGVFVGPLALGVAIGRWGCLFSGLPDRTFGTPTALPWAVDLGDGIGRHPVQIYESLVVALFLAVYLTALAKRRPWAFRRSFYGFCAWYSLQRFAWEFFKPYPKLWGPFNVFHLICGGLAIYGFFCWRRDVRRERCAQERALFVPRPNHQPLRNLP